MAVDAHGAGDHGEEDAEQGRQSFYGVTEEYGLHLLVGALAPVEGVGN